MKRGVIWKSLVILLTLLALLPLAAGCQAKPPSEAEIRVGIIAGLTGPAASVVAPLMDELEHIFRYTNEVEGGIADVKISWRIVDNKGTPDGSIIAYKELRDTFAPQIYLTDADYYLTGVKDMITEDKAVILTLSALTSTLFVPPGRFFSMGITTADGFAGYIKWVLQDWKGEGKPKIGVLHWDLPSGLVWKLATAWAQKQGVELVPVSYSIVTLELKPQLLSLKDAKVDYIWMLGISPNAAVAIRDFRGLGLMGKIPFTFNEFTDATTVLSLAGAGAEGFYEYRAESPYADGTKAAKLYSEIWKWATGKDKWSDLRILITVKAVLEAAIKQAVVDVGWAKLDGEAVYNALNKLTNIDTWGNMEGFGFGPAKRVGVSTIKMKRYTATGAVGIGDWIKLPRVFEGVDK